VHVRYPHTHTHTHTHTYIAPAIAAGLGAIGIGGTAFLGTSAGTIVDVVIIMKWNIIQNTTMRRTEYVRIRK